MRTVLVTGGAGFIGSHLARGLQARGDRVRVLDNFSSGKVENLPGMESDYEVLEGDLRDAQRVKEAVRGVEFIFHQAAFVSVPKSIKEPQECFDINVQGTLNLLEAARHAGVIQVVIASSAAVYGESQALPLHEDTSLRTLSPYAASKQMGEVLAGLYTRAYGLPVVSLRYFNVYGPRQAPDTEYAAVIPIFIRRLLKDQAPTVYGDGHQRRDFVYVADVVRANLLAAECPQAAGEAYNICTGQETSLLELLEILKEVLPGAQAAQCAPARAGDIYRSTGDPSGAMEALGFRAQVNLNQGLAETVNWMRSQMRPR